MIVFLIFFQGIANDVITTSHIFLFLFDFCWNSNRLNSFHIIQIPPFFCFFWFPVENRYNTRTILAYFFVFHPRTWLEVYSWTTEKWRKTRDNEERRRRRLIYLHFLFPFFFLSLSLLLLVICYNVSLWLFSREQEASRRIEGSRVASTKNEMKWRNSRV